jgi:hypothetical protein
MMTVEIHLPLPPPSGGGTGSPTVVIGGVDVPVWYIDNYISNSNWANQRPGQATGGGGPGADVHAFFDQFSNYNPPGGGSPQNTDPPITDCLTDAFPSEDQPSSEQGGGSSLAPGLTILQLLTDLHGQSEETFDLIMNVHNQVDLNQDQGRYLIYNTNEANIINEALENGTTTAATVSGYLNFRLTIDPCQSIVPGLNFELLLSKPEIFNLLAGHLLEDPTDSEHIQVVNLIASNPDILNVHLDDDDGPNYCELELILSGFSYARCAWSINENADIATSMTVERFGYNGRNDCSDAFRHAFFNALNAMSCDIDMAREFGEAHECDVPNELIMEKEMDLWNNEIGYSIISDFGALSNHNALADIVLLRLSESEGKYLTPLDADSKIIPGVTGIALTHDDCLP